MRNKTVTEIRRTKKNFHEKQVDKCKQKPKKMWTHLKKIIGNKKKCKGQEEILFDEMSYTDEEIIADKFNKYFIESIDKIVEGFGVNDGRGLKHIAIHCESKLDEFQTADDNQMDQIIKSLDTNKGKSDQLST